MENKSLKINFKDLELIKYREFLKIQKELTSKKENYILFATHYPIYTKGKFEKNFPFALSVNRGGSITYFDEGTLMVYFIFNVNSPPFFYKNVKKTVSRFLSQFSLPIFYDRKRPGFYIENRKIASLGFSYINGRSNHGISIHINPNLQNFNKVNPCNLKGIEATSLFNEGVKISTNKAKKSLEQIIKEVFL